MQWVMFAWTPCLGKRLPVLTTWVGVGGGKTLERL